MEEGEGDDRRPGRSEEPCGKATRAGGPRRWRLGHWLASTQLGKVGLPWGTQSWVSPSWKDLALAEAPVFFPDVS